MAHGPLMLLPHKPHRMPLSRFFSYSYTGAKGAPAWHCLNSGHVPITRGKLEAIVADERRAEQERQRQALGAF